MTDRSDCQRRGPRFLPHLGVATVALGILLGSPRSAHAGDAATADALFRAGREAMQRGDYADAVHRFAESQRVEPAPGTLLNLAVAEEKLGKLSAAWEHARSAAEQLPSADDRARVARDLFTSLDRRVPRLVLRSKGLPAEAQVKLDGSELRGASFGLPIPVDPGIHRVTISAPGRLERILTIDATEASTSEGVLDVGPAVADHGPTERATEGGSSLRTLGWVSLGVAGAALLAGGAFGLVAIDKNGTVEERCTPTCDQEGGDAAKSGRTFATLSTISFIGAGVLAATGVVLLLVAPKATPTRPTRPESAAFDPLRITF